MALEHVRSPCVSCEQGGNQQVTAQGADGRFIDLVAFLDVDSQGIAEVSASTRFRDGCHCGA